MSQHMPECDRWFASMPEPDECPACEMFRACENRALEAYSVRTSSFQEGYIAGVSAAHEAVDALPLVMAFTGELAIIRKPEALAAIDNLLEKP